MKPIWIILALVLLLAIGSFAGVLGVVTTPTVAASGNVTTALLCTDGPGGENASNKAKCTTTGTPTAGILAAAVFYSFATTVPTSANVTCTDNSTGGPNTWTFRGQTGISGSSVNITLVTATLTHVSSGMQISCTSTQTGVSFGNNIYVFSLANTVSGLDGTCGVSGSSPCSKQAGSSSTTWTSDTVTPSATGDGCVGAIANRAAAATNLTTGAPWTAQIGIDLADSNLGPSMSGLRSNYASTSATSITFTCASGCSADASPVMLACWK